MMNFPHRCAAGAVLLASLLSGCAGLVGPRQVELPLAKMQANIDKRFPLHNKALDLLDVELSHPQLALSAQRQRVSLSLDASIAPPFLRQSWTGNMALSGQLALDNVRHAVVMRDVQLDRFAIDGTDEGRQRQFARVANVLAERVVHEVVIYSFNPDDLRRAGIQFVPTRISMSDNAVQVTLEPEK
ncbi:MAG: DUF1439 domain-containing protein [Pseudomonadota bacterium]